jgi:hypothetical protein
MKKNTSLLFLYMAISTAILVPASLTPNLFTFGEFSLDKITQLLTFLALISLFLERALEVFIATWRHPGEDGFDNEIQSYERQIADLKNGLVGENPPDQEELSHKIADFEKVNLRRTEYKSQTKRIALWTALFIGVVISGVGIRALETLLKLIDLKDIPQNQQPIFYTGQLCIFRFFDTLLTGGLIAGGSDGIHKLTNLVTAFLDETQNRIKDQS